MLNLKLPVCVTSQNIEHAAEVLHMTIDKDKLYDEVVFLKSV